MKKSLLSIAVTATVAGLVVSHAAPASNKADGPAAYKATIDVREPDVAPSSARAVEQEAVADKVAGFVFEDLDRDGVFDNGEPGIEGVMVSNGLEVVTTDRRGKYQIPKRYYRDDMNISVSKPACYEVPVDENNVPQFAYIHKQSGSPKAMVFGGLAPSGRLPRQINFPLIKGDCKEQFKIAVSGDTQPYSNVEVGYVRDTLAKELAGRNDLEALIVAGDVMGDDLGLLPRYLSAMRAANVPHYLVAGNHDVDFDADTDGDSTDSFRRIWGPNYYSFTIGKVHFVVLDNVTYPCENTIPETGEPDPEKRWAHCEGRKSYNGRISETQLKWLENDLAHVPEDRLIVLSYHIPTVSFVDQSSHQHSEDNAFRLYKILGYALNADGTWKKGRPALALSGHTHTLDQFRPGEIFEGWTKANHPASMPFPQIIVGAACGSWWSGDVDDDLIPESYQRLGAPKGYFLFSFDGNTYKDELKASGKPADKQMSLSFNSPAFRAWFSALADWYSTSSADPNSVPPVNTNDLGDTKLLKPSDLAETDLVVNVWNGSRDSEVRVQFDDLPPVIAERTQEGAGEAVVESIDPHALRRQMNVLRYALKSSNDDPNQLWNGNRGDRSEGFELYNGSVFKAGSQRPLANGLWTVQSNHVWTAPLPTGLEDGVHRVVVYTKDVHGHAYEESMLFEVRTPNELPDPIENDPTDEKYDRTVPSEL